MSFYVTKASGKKELFDIKKFRRSLKKAGADEQLIQHIAAELLEKPKIRSTREIYDFALQYLDKKSPGIAARYNIKRALTELGPAGFPFEQFIAELFRAQGYNATVGMDVQGKCVEHEVDIVAAKNEQQYMIECKFHNRAGLKTDVKDTLYIKARFDDIEDEWDKDPQHGHKFHQAWVVTNTKFTGQAVKYAKCVGIKLLGWSYPYDDNLQTLIDRYKLHPITALAKLSRAQKKAFIKNGLVLCRDAQKHQKLLVKLGFSPHQIKKIIEQAQQACELTPMPNKQS